MTAIPFPLSNGFDDHGQESAGRILNAYAEPLGSTAPSKSIYHRAPGLVNFGTTARTIPRAMINVGGVLYVGYSGKLEKFTSSGGASTNVGNLGGTKRGFFARNNASTPDKVFTDPDGNVTTFTPTAVAGSYPDADLPAPCDVTSLDGYLVFAIADGRMFATGLNTTAVDPLSFGTAEARPDGITRVVTYGNRLFIFGTNTTEIWIDQGNIPFPFGRASVMPRGILGPYCVAGFEDGFGRDLIWVGDDNGVYKLNGWLPEKISPTPLDTLIEAVSDKTTLEACVYISRGHAFWQLSCAAWTWVFDLNTQKWHERVSYGLTRSRISVTANTYGKWLCGDNQTGSVQQIINTAFNEVGSDLRFRIESGPVEKFPTGERVGRADFNFVTGVGVATGTDPIQTDPNVEISWSDDGGSNWSPPILGKLGKQSETNGLVSLVACTGRSSWNGRRWRIDVNDPVYVGFMGGSQSANPRIVG